MRDGSDLVGWGMASGVWEALQVPVAVRIVLTANGHAEVSCAASDIGTGTYTIVAQMAADRLGLPIENITVKLGDSSLPQAPVEGGSWMAASAAHAVAAVADEVREELLKLAKGTANPALTVGRVLADAASATDQPRGRDLGVDAAGRPGADREGEAQHLRRRTIRTRATPTRRSSPK